MQAGRPAVSSPRYEAGRGAPGRAGHIPSGQDRLHGPRRHPVGARRLAVRHPGRPQPGARRGRGGAPGGRRRPGGGVREDQGPDPRGGPGGGSGRLCGRARGAHRVPERVGRRGGPSGWNAAGPGDRGGGHRSFRGGRVPSGEVCGTARAPCAVGVPRPGVLDPSSRQGGRRCNQGGAPGRRLRLAGSSRQRHPVRRASAFPGARGGRGPRVSPDALRGQQTIGHRPRSGTTRSASR